MTFIIIMKERRYKILWQSTLSLGENKEVPPHHFFLCSPSSNSRRSNFLKRWAQRALFGSAHSAAATVRRCRATVQTSKTTTADTEQGHLKKWTEIKADDMTHSDIFTLVKIQSIHSTQYYALLLYSELYFKQPNSVSYQKNAHVLAAQNPSSIEIKCVLSSH